jgi:hypothetical protein
MASRLAYRLLVAIRSWVVEPSKAPITLLKLTAAQRQLDAAIRMTFAGEDPLAITTVAAAACRVLCDLQKSADATSSPTICYTTGSALPAPSLGVN